MINQIALSYESACILLVSLRLREKQLNKKVDKEIKESFLSGLEKAAIEEELSTISELQEVIDNIKRTL